MKNLTLLLTILVFGIFACQQTKPPKEVTDAFAQKFTSTEKVVWDQEEENEWEANFIMSGKEMSACFDNAGKWLETETAMGEEDLPALVSDTLSILFEGLEIEKAENLEKPDFKGFEVVLENDSVKLEVQITASGEIINKKVVEEDEEIEDENAEVGENKDKEEDVD